MLSVYDFLCNGRRDPHGVREPLELSWRLGSDRQGADQAAYRVVVTSMTDGACKWDTGRVKSSANVVTYAGEPLAPGETCVWFVSAEDDEGGQADGVPAAFSLAGPDEEPISEWGPQRTGFVWTSDPELDDRLEHAGESEQLGSAAWTELLGVRLDGRRVIVSPHVGCDLARGLRFVQGSMLVSRGLLLVRWERRGAGVRLEVILPPGMRGTLELGDERREVTSGRHVLRR